jgi:hypothetical protein
MEDQNTILHHERYEFEMKKLELFLLRLSSDKQHAFRVAVSMAIQARLYLEAMGKMHSFIDWIEGVKRGCKICAEEREVEAELKFQSQYEEYKEGGFTNE